MEGIVQISGGIISPHTTLEEDDDTRRAGIRVVMGEKK